MVWDQHEWKRASSGVYLVFVSDDQGVEKMVTKILFIK